MPGWKGNSGNKTECRKLGFPTYTERILMMFVYDPLSSLDKAERVDK